jgi:hypothetical protein
MWLLLLLQAVALSMIGGNLCAFVFSASLGNMR